MPSLISGIFAGTSSSSRCGCCLSAPAFRLRVVVGVHPRDLGRQLDRDSPISKPTLSPEPNGDPMKVTPAFALASSTCPPTSRSPAPPRDPNGNGARSSWVRVARRMRGGRSASAYFGGALTGTPLRHRDRRVGAARGRPRTLHQVEKHPRQMEERGRRLGRAGAGSTIWRSRRLDVAQLWDIRGKDLNQPLWRLLGGGRDKVSTYALGRADPANCRSTASSRPPRRAALGQGLEGDEDPARTPRRGRPRRSRSSAWSKIREAIGPDIKLMCDINQRWRPEQAMDIGRRVEDAGVGLFWLEDDPRTADDYAGLARIAPTTCLPTPVIAGGGIRPGHRAVPPHDGERAPSTYPDGPTSSASSAASPNGSKVAGMAEAFNLPVVSHLIPEVHVHLIGATPNDFLTVEYMPWLGHYVRRRCRDAAGRRAGDADQTRPQPRIRPRDARALRGLRLPVVRGAQRHGNLGRKCAPGTRLPRPRNDQYPMKIASLETDIVLLSPMTSRSPGFPRTRTPKNPIVTLRLSTDDGIRGARRRLFRRRDHQDAAPRDRRARRADRSATTRSGLEGIAAKLRAAAWLGRSGRDCRRWRCRRSMSRCGTSRAKRSASR